MKLFPPSRVLHLVLLAFLSFTVRLFADTTWGNPLLFGTAPLTATVDTSTAQWTRFTVWDAITITAVQVRLKDVKAPALTVGIYEDNGNGAPKVKPLATAQIDSPKEEWNRAVFKDVPLEESGIYYLVLEETSEGSAGWMCVNVAGRNIQASGKPDPMWAHGSGSRLDSRTALMFFFETKSDINFGQPYLSKLNCKLHPGRQIPAQRFVFDPPPTGESAVAGATLSLNIARPIEGNYTLAILDEKDQVVESVKIPGSQVEAAPPRNYTFALSGTTRLAKGKNYALVFYSDDDAVDGAWASSVTEQGDKEAEKATWQGVAGHAFKYADDSFGSATEPELYRDMVFSFELQ